MTELHAAPLRDIDPLTLYAILQLRTDVFVVEQECAYAELDGRDVEPSTVLIWAVGEGGTVVGTLRLLEDGPRLGRIGRVATAKQARGAGLAAELMERAISLADGTELVLDAQSHLQAWYERFGFSRDGDEYIEDGIPHVPMRRAVG